MVHIHISFLETNMVNVVNDDPEYVYVPKTGHEIRLCIKYLH